MSQSEYGGNDARDTGLPKPGISPNLHKRVEHKLLTPAETLRQVYLTGTDNPQAKTDKQRAWRGEAANAYRPGDRIPPNTDVI